MVSKFQHALCLIVTTLIATPLFAADNFAANPTQLVRDMTYNELHASQHGKKFMYRDTERNKKGTVVKEIVQTPQGPLSRVISRDGKPLPPQQRAKEDEKLKKFANDTDARRKKEQSDKEESQREDLMVKTLPDAFLYTYAGTVKEKDGRDLVHLTFKPNPNFSPPNHETQVYVGMQGDMFIDPAAKRLAKIDGTLFKEVNFGWGILGKLDPGGKFVIEQTDIGDGIWQMATEQLRFTGKILMVKPLEIDSRETTSDWRPVPGDITTAQALDLLEKADEVLAENGGGVKEHK